LGVGGAGPDVGATWVTGELAREPGQNVALRESVVGRDLGVLEHVSGELVGQLPASMHGTFAHRHLGTALDRRRCMHLSADLRSVAAVAEKGASR
jgi:hypothetical protein